MNKSAVLSVKFRFFRFLILIFSLVFTKKVKGIQNIPKEGPFIVAANHLSHIDPFLIGTYVSRVAKKYVHFLSALKYDWNPLFRFLVETSHGIWADSKIGGQTLLVALEYLKHGEIIGILPEGARSPDGKIRKGKTGIATLAISAKVPVVPIGVINTNKVLPRGAWHPHLARCEINFGKPLIFDAYCKEHDEALNQGDRPKILDVEEKVLRMIMKEIARLSNQEYPF